MEGIKQNQRNNVGALISFGAQIHRRGDLRHLPAR